MGRKPKVKIYGKHKRKFGGKLYTLFDSVFTKVEAENVAKKVRKRGNRVRIITIGHGDYELYMRKGKRG